MLNTELELSSIAHLIFYLNLRTRTELTILICARKMLQTGTSVHMMLMNDLEAMLQTVDERMRTQLMLHSRLKMLMIRDDAMKDMINL